MTPKSRIKAQSRTKAPRGRPRSLESEHAILDATAKILHKEGYAGLTTDKVAALAKVSKATIYRRWPTKEHLVLAVLDRVPQIVPVDKGNLVAELCDLHDQGARMAERGPMKPLLPMLMGEGELNPQLREPMLMFHEKRRIPVRMALQRAIARGELPRDCDVELALDVLIGATMLRDYMLGRDPTDAWIKRLTHFVIRGLGARVPKATQ
jgi:AcrR family transcriptional regulator